MLQNDNNYQLFISLNNETVTGLSLLYTFRSLSIGLLDYMVVIPTHHRQGIGTQLFDFTLQKLRSVVSNGIGLLMEIQRENFEDPRETIVRKNRIKFYTALGAKILDGVEYLLPPLQSAVEPEKMYLMIRPLREMEHLSKQSFVRYINAIYSTIYHYHEHDLLDKISQKLPPRIMLHTMVTQIGTS